MKIKFIAQYVNVNGREANNRVFSPGGVSKMSYYLRCFKELSCPVKIFSTAPSNGVGGGEIRRAIKEENSIGQMVKYRISLFSKNRYLRLFDLIFGQFQIALHLLFCKSDEIVFIYHERYYTPIVRRLSFVFKFRVICSIEEIYTLAARNTPKKVVAKEIQSFDFPKGRTSFILAASELTKFISPESKSIVCNGVYAPCVKSAAKTSDRLQILYAGTFDRNKGGVYLAIEAAKHLNSQKYEINICGFGREDEVECVKRMIEESNASPTSCRIKYLGRLLGNEYFELLEKCDIGLACQNTATDLSESAFPSKIYEYLRFGLIVVSSDVLAVRKSACAANVIFFEDYSPFSLAQAISTINTNRCRADNQQFMEDLHLQFKKSLNQRIYEE